MIKKERQVRKTRIRAKIAGTAERPRLSVFRSAKYIYVQAIDDEKGATLAFAKGEDSKKVGSEIAEKLGKKKIKKVVFDRGGFAYHGRIKDLADAAREGGLEF